MQHALVGGACSYLTRAASIPPPLGLVNEDGHISASVHCALSTIILLISALFENYGRWLVGGFRVHVTIFPAFLVQIP